MSIRRMALLLLGVACAGYAALCALVYLQQDRLIYFPQATRLAAADTDLALRRDDGTVVRGWRLHAGAPKVLLYFGGNGEDLRGFRDRAAQAFPAHEIYLLAYRGYGASDGSPGEAALTGDAVALYDWIRTQRPDAAIDVIGRSLGSGVAAQLAARRPLHRLVLVTPFDSLLATARAHYRWLPVRWLLRDRYRSDQALAHAQAPLLVLRAGHDAVVPAANTDALIAALPRPAQVVAFDAADHDSISADPRYLATITRFLD
jgi:uncharacterized protein